MESRPAPTSASGTGRRWQSCTLLAQLAPEVGAVRELYGLTLYRLGRWREAARELRAFHDLTGSFDQHPVIADSERALGRDKAVLALWDALRQEGVDREVLVEARLVVAGMMADRGDLEGAIALLGRAASPCAIPTLAISGSGTPSPTSTKGRATFLGARAVHPGRVASLPISSTQDPLGRSALIDPRTLARGGSPKPPAWTSADNPDGVVVGVAH